MPTFRLRKSTGGSTLRGGDALRGADTPTILPSAISGAEAFGTPLLLSDLGVIGITSAEAFGTPSIQLVGFITTTGITSDEALGNPALYKAGTVVIPGGGGVYGGGPIYGPISSSLATAQNGQVRETGLEVTVINERVNAWEYFSGQTVDGRIVWRPIQFTSGARQPIHQDYWSYRGTASSVKLTNGNIIRIRNCDSTDPNSRVIQIQTITNPLDPTQWETWSTLYSGANYACCIVPSGASYDVYHTKADGLYKNNSLVWSQSNLISVKAVENQPKAVFVMKVVEDPVDGAGRYRDLDLYYTSNIDSVAPTADPSNYRWYRNYIWGYELPDGRVARFQSNSWYFNPRIGDQGNSVVLQFLPSSTSNVPGPPRIIRGLGGGSNGRNYIVYPFVKLLSDGFFYMFYVEIHEDSSYDFVTNLYGSAFWQRSKDFKYWSEPTAVGFNGWDFNGLIEHSGYVWLLDNGSVWRRPSTPANLDLSNYIPELSFSLPRDNQAGTGTATVANPEGVNDSVIELGGREVRIGIGMKIADGSYEYTDFNRWFLTEPLRNIEPLTGANRITLPFGDIWERLSNPLRDVYNLVGKLEWKDWQEGARNRAFNYFFVDDDAPVEHELNDSDTVVTPFQLSTQKNVLYTGWKGHNGVVEVKLSDITTDTDNHPAIIYRYIDEKNYYRVENTGSTFQLIRKRVDVETVLASGGGGGFGTVKVDFRWAVHKVYVDGGLIITHTETVPGSKPGYTGFCAALGATVSNFSFNDYEDVLTTEDMTRLALALGDFHDAVVSGGESKELAITWGPQTDIPTPADALLQSLTANKLQLIWRNGQVEIGKFTDNSIKRIIDNRIIETDYIDSEEHRINFAAVDGNDDSWLEFDASDIRRRDRQLNAYFDLPELTDPDAVKARAQEEIRRSLIGRSPGGNVVLYFDLFRMDVVTWIDQTGRAQDVRIEGMDISINQSTKPRQNQSLDTSLLDGSGVPTPLSDTPEDPPITPDPVPTPASPPAAPTGLGGVAGDTIVDLSWNP